ncbi:MAG: GNAT family N-acetyltransferase [Bacteroidales bacterium]|nr:GNAT family N-acetyltransferase [Bacteroidales bacterium]
MRKQNQEITDKNILEEILSESHLCRLAMVDNGKPYLLPFNYGYADNTIYMHCAHEGRKIDILRENPHVCFEITQTSELIKGDSACKWSELYRSVVGEGIIDIITGFDQKKKILEIIMAHNGAPELTNFEDKQVEATTILQLNIQSISGKQSGNWNKIMSQLIYETSSKRLLLEEFQWSDLVNLNKLHSIPECDEFNTLGIPKTIEDTQKLLKFSIDAQKKHPRSFYNWKVIEKESEKFIGEAGLILSNDKFKLGEIFYKLNPKYWGKGYGTEISKHLIHVGFKDFDLQKVEAGVATENIRSIRVLEKSGMTREGLRRKILPIRGEWLDNYHYAIVKDDPR